MGLPTNEASIFRPSRMGQRPISAPAVSGNLNTLVGFGNRPAAVANSAKDFDSLPRNGASRHARLIEMSSKVKHLGKFSVLAPGLHIGACSQKTKSWGRSIR